MAELAIEQIATALETVRGNHSGWTKDFKGRLQQAQRIRDALKVP